MLGLTAGSAQAPASADVTSIRPDSAVTRHRTAKIDGVEIFYREAGPADAPVVLLLHGFPTSSHMFRNLIPLLADRYRVIAPDYPGFGQSASADRATSTYTLREVRRHGGRTYSTQLGADALRAVRDGLRRARRLPPGDQASRTRPRTHRPERQRLREGPARILDADQGLLGRPAKNRDGARGVPRSPRPRSSSTPTACSDRHAHRVPTTGCTIRPCSIVPATARSSSTCSTTDERRAVSEVPGLLPAPSRRR